MDLQSEEVGGQRRLRTEGEDRPKFVAQSHGDLLRHERTPRLAFTV
jgi:hypothetical protein